MALSDEVLARMGGSTGKVLVNLTNPDGITNATSVNTTILAAACADAQAAFSRIAGYTFDVTLAHHVELCIPGVLYYLESYKGRDSGIIKERKSTFYAGLKGYRENAILAPSTSSTLLATTQTDDTAPDMDRNNSVFRPRIGNTVQIEDVNEGT